MALLEGILGKRKKTIASTTLDELTMAKVKLEQEQERVMRRVGELEKDKGRLFQQGVNEPSKRRQLLVAQKIQELEFQAKNYDKNLAAYQKQMRVLNGLIWLKENRQSWEQTAVGQILGGMELDELEGFVDQATAKDVFQMDKFERLLGSLEDADDFSGREEMDEGVTQILSEMQRAREAGGAGLGLEKPERSLGTEPTDKL